MPIQGWEQLIEPGPAVADGTALTSSTTPTSILAAANKVGLYANFFRIGKKIRVYASGRISILNPTPGTLTLEMRIGPASPPTIVCMSSGALVLCSTTAKTNVAWEMTWDATCRSVGVTTAATLFHQGKLISEACVGGGATAGVTGTNMMPASAPAVGTGFDSTVSNFFDLFATWSVSNAANSIQCHQFHIEELN